MNKLKLIFLACKYSETDVYLVQRNIHHATYYAQEVALLGALPLCPALISANFEGIQTYDWWSDAYMELMYRCDAVFMVPNHERSDGATREHEEALKIGKPVFYDLKTLNDWIKQ